MLDAWPTLLSGWPLFFVCAGATALTLLFGRRQPLVWIALGVMFFALRLSELGVAAWVGAVVILVWRISNPPESSRPG